jgi:anti-sigma B factor antagonist
MSNPTIDGTSGGASSPSGYESTVYVGSDLIEEFGVSVVIAAAQAVLRVQGEVDCHSSPYLWGVLDAAIDAGHSDVVLDLASMEFMDASGLRVIANAANRLELLGGTLAIRSPSTLVLRMLDITGMAELTIPEPRNPAAAVG